MTIKLQLSSGKEIELTKEEYDELCGKIVPIPQLVPIEVIPYYPRPYIPYSPWDGTLVVSNCTVTNGPKVPFTNTAAPQ